MPSSNRRSCVLLSGIGHGGWPHCAGCWVRLWIPNHAGCASGRRGWGQCRCRGEHAQAACSRAHLLPLNCLFTSCLLHHMVLLEPDWAAECISMTKIIFANPASQNIGNARAGTWLEYLLPHETSWLQCAASRGGSRICACLCEWCARGAWSWRRQHIVPCWQCL